MWTRAGLEYAIAQHEVTYLDVDVRSPFVVIPEYGTLQRDGSVLAVDLGHLKVVSNLASRDASVRKASDHELEEMFYDKFEVTLDDVQVMIFDKSFNWESVQGVSTSPYHILPSIALKLQLQKSITSDNSELPQFKISSVLPSVHLKLSDEKFKKLMKFLDHLPFGVQQPSLLEEKRADVLSKNEWKHSSSTLSLEEASDLQALFNNVMVARLHSTEDEDVWYDTEENLPEERAEDDQAVVKETHDVDKIKLAGDFTIEKLLITVDKASEQSTSDDPYLILEIRDLGAHLIVHSWDIHAEVKLGFIQMLDNHWKDIDGSNLCVLTSSATNDWITINYVKADPTGPEFKGKFHSIEQLVEMKFSSLKLTAKQEAIASFQMFVLNLFQSTGGKPEWAAVPQRLLETITEEDQPDSSVVTKGLMRSKSTDEKPDTDSDAVSFKIVAQVEEVTVILSSMDRHVGKVVVTGLDVKIDVFTAETNITTKLEDLGIEDLTEETLYPQILDLADNTVFDCKVTIFNKSLQGAFADQDPTALDFSIDVKLGKLRFVFLGYFMAHLQNFLQALVSPETVAYAQEVTQKVVLNQVQHIHKQGAKIGLNISVKAPQIIVPCNSRSSEKLIADLGQLHISNSIVSSSQYGLIDRMDVRLSSFQVSGNSEEEKHLSEYLIEPVELSVIVKRRLNLEKSNLPLIEVEGNLELFKINLGVNDFQMLMMVLNDNLLEGQHGKYRLDAYQLQSVPKADVMPQQEQQETQVAPETDSLDKTDAKSMEEVPNVKCHFTISKVLISSPKIVDGVPKPYLVLETNNMSATVTMETWILNASAKLGTIELLDHLNEDVNGAPVRLLSSSRHADLISVSYKRVDPRCPEFESTFCTIEQQIKVTFSKLKIDCLHKALMDLQLHGLALISSLGDTSSVPTLDSQSSPETGQKAQSTVSLKVEAALSEVDILVRHSHKNLADIKVRGLTAELLLWEGGLVLKSRQNDLSVVDLNANSYYPKIISVENENVFDLEFKYFNNTNQPKINEPSTTDLTRPDGNLELNIGKINIVFLYRFITELLQFVEPLTSPQSTEYVKATAQRAATEQIESLQSQGTRIGLQVAISAPLIIIPRHSHSVDMLLVDLGHLDLQNEFDLLPLPNEHDNRETVFDVMELSLQSVQLTRGVMDLSSSAVIKRHLIEPIKLDANIKRSLLTSCQDVPILECSATLDFVKMNLGQQDYHVLATLFQENLKESDSFFVMEEEKQPSQNMAEEQTEHIEPTNASNTSAEPGAPEEAAVTVWDQMVFSFDLVGASLTLYSNERTLDPFDSQSSFCEPATRLCLCEVDKSVVTVVLPSDSSVQIHCMLNGCVVEDVRKGTISAFPRLIDKKMATYASVTKSSSKEMCDIVFCQLPSGEMKVDISLQNATIFVNFPFLLPLLEFFTTQTSDLHNQQQHHVTTASQTSLDTAPVRVSDPAIGDGDGTLHRLESKVIAATRTFSQVDAAPLPAQGSQMKISVHGVVKEPDIVLLSDATRSDSEALIVQAEVEFNFNLEDVKQVLSANLTNLQMQASQFPDVKRTSYKVLNPCSLTFKYLTPATSEGGQDIAITLEEMVFDFSPGLLTTVSNVVTALTGQQKVDESVQTTGQEVIAAPTDLWDTKSASAEYWYKKKATEDSKPKLVTRKSTGDKLSLTTKEVQVVLVNEIEGAHVPLLLVRSFVSAKVSDWAAQLKVEADVAVQVSYYNECLAAWEPLLEPVMVEDEKTMWEVQLKLFLAEGYVSSFSPKDVESCDGPPRDKTDASRSGDVTDSGLRSLAQKRSSFRRSQRLSSLRCSGRRGWPGKRQKRRYYPTGTTSDDEDDLDYEGALTTFVQSTQRAFIDPSAKSEHGLDSVDAPPDEVDAADRDRQTQATYIVINSHDVMQLTVTPKAIQILTELSELWTVDRSKKLRTVPGPTFAIHNELGVHSSVTVSAKLQVSDGDQLTVRQKIPKRPSVRQHSLADVAVDLGNRQKSSPLDLKRILSEPLFNHLREKLHKIRRKRASSEPISLEAIRQRKLSLQNPALFQIGEHLGKTKCLKKSYSLESGVGTNGKTVMPPRRPESPSSRSVDQIPEDEAIVTKTSNDAEMLSARPPPEELEERDDPHSTAGLAETQVGHTIANIGSLFGGIVAPRHAAENNDKDSEIIGPDADMDDDNIISLTVDGFYNVSSISIARSGSYLHKLSPKDAVLREANHNWYLAVQVEIKNGRKTVTIRSPLQVQNHLQVPVDLFVRRKESSDSNEEHNVKLFTVESSGVQNVPLYEAYNDQLYVKPSDANYNISSSALSWSTFTKEEPSCVLACSSVKDSQHSSAFFIKALCQADNFSKLPTDSPHHVIHLYPPLVLHNKLPFELVLSTQDKGGEDKFVLPGDKVPFVNQCPGDSCQITITLTGYKEVNWIGHLAVRKERYKFLELPMQSQEEITKQVSLGVVTMHQSGTRELFIYSPYWLINKTGLHVEYRVSKTKQVYQQSAVEKHPLLFNFIGRSYRKAKLRLPGQPWSSKFSLDAVGDSGKVTCKAGDSMKFEFILQIEMSRTGLTKIVTLTPKYVIINNTEISVSFIENRRKNALWFVVEPGESKPFWPNDKSSSIVLKPTMSNVISKPFNFNSSHTTVLRIPELQALTVDVHGEVEDAVTTIVVTPYSPGIATIRIENLCDNIPIRFHQKDSGQVTVLDSKQMILYTWDDPLGVRKLLWKPYTGIDKPIEAPVNKDDFGEIRVELDESSPPVKDDRKQLEGRDTTCGLHCGSSYAVPEGMDQDLLDNVDGPMYHRVKKTIHWVSVMDGLQRVLIFADDESLSCLARKCCDYEIVNMEVFMSLDGVGLSLVNSKPDEVAYITLASSSSVWQVERSPGRWKTLNLEWSTWLEDAWRNNAGEVALEDREVNFNSMSMTRPYRGAIRRLFEPALWLNYTSSDHYHSLHCKMHRIQIDNQQIGTVFPVALYPSPLPASVIQKSGFKPFIEVSVIYHQVPKEGMYHIKYAKALVQEMNVKIDKGLIISMTSFFSQQKELLEEENYFEEDMKRVAVPLRETEAVKAALETQKVFLEYFHLSPLKINLSFSLASSFDEEDEDQAFAQDLLDFFVDSIGATLTDINDAQLKMAYFERVSVFLTQENLVAQIRRHYTMQGVRQVYVLVLGLDVLGNPYALIHGIGEGVRDFFYEPYQGIIAGPGGFAEGVARGVKSLLGHVIGGTAGAFSRITGSLGQAVATLSFDSNFQMRRRLRMHRGPQGIGQGLIMGGKSLFMGLFFGVTGVVVKPVEGARSEGVEGFFKGIGKGLLGLLTHPAGGVIDMVSFTLDGVRRSAEQNGEDIACRMRLPRYTAPNMPLKPFSEHDAKGNGILKSLDSLDDVYVDHMSITEEDSSVVILLTDRRILNLYQRKFWLGWKLRWSCLYENITGFPFIATNALIIKQDSHKDEGSTIDLAAPTYEIVSKNKSELETLKSKIDKTIRHYR
ncbi:hypothetical protein ACROYT_G021452 [Oculina patagonica]